MVENINKLLHIFKDNFYITNDKTDLFKKVFFCSTQLVRRSNLMVEPLWYTHTCIQMAEIQTLLMFSNSVKGFYEMFVKKKKTEKLSYFYLHFYMMIHVTYVYLFPHMVKL